MTYKQMEKELNEYAKQLNKYCLKAYVKMENDQVDDVERRCLEDSYCWGLYVEKCDIPFELGYDLMSKADVETAIDTMMFALDTYTFKLKNGKESAA